MFGWDLLTRCRSLLNALRSPLVLLAAAAVALALVAFTAAGADGRVMFWRPASICSSVCAPAGSAGAGPGGMWACDGPPAGANVCGTLVPATPASRVTSVDEPRAVPSAGVEELLGARGGNCLLTGLNWAASNSSRRTTFPPDGSTTNTEGYN